MTNPTNIAYSNIDVDQLLAQRRQVAVVWSIEDVLHVRPQLTADQAWDVLCECKDAHDSEWGFTWNFIQDVADILFPRHDNKSDIEKGA